MQDLQEFFTECDAHHHATSRGLCR